MKLYEYGCWLVINKNPGLPTFSMRSISTIKLLGTEENYNSLVNILRESANSYTGFSVYVNSRLSRKLVKGPLNDDWSISVRKPNNAITTSMDLRSPPATFSMLMKIELS